jgi:signal transduction histidine kinase
VSSLFFKLFSWFWGAVVVLALTFAGTILATNYRLIRHRRTMVVTAAAITTRAAAVAYQRLGPSGLKEVAAMDTVAFEPFYAFDATLTELQGQLPPADARNLAREVFVSTRRTCVRRGIWIACRAPDTDRRGFALVIGFPVSLRHAILLAPGEWAVLIPALVLVAGLICFWLARYLTEPVSRLRWLTRRFADGDLEARADLSRFHHSEELHGLATDFNRMAQRIQTLLDHQAEFLRDVSHELRTPLTRIALAAGLTRQRLSEPVPEEFARIDRELERVNDLIGQVLAMARLDNGAPLEDSEVVDLSAVVDEVVRDAALEADADGVSVCVRGARAGQVVGNRALLRIAFENVLRNAIRHSPRQSAVWVDVGTDPTPRGLASVAVTDEGPGVSADDLPRLFDPFFRTAETRATHPSGAGLGLAMTRRIVERHQGTITADNRRDRHGLVVRMLLPLLVA